MAPSSVVFKACGFGRGCKWSVKDQVCLRQIEGCCEMGIKWCRRHQPWGIQKALLTVRFHCSAFFRSNALASSWGSDCTFPPPKLLPWVLNGSQNTPSPPRSCSPLHEQGPHRLPMPWELGKERTGRCRAAQEHPKSGSQAFGMGSSQPGARRG